MSEVVKDSKEVASRTFADVVERTQNNFPDARFRPSLLQQSALNTQYGIDAHGYKVFANADGGGTKPELAERLFAETGNPIFLKRVAHDVVAMVADDVARKGAFVAGIVNSVDMNTAEDATFVSGLASGMEEACSQGRFPLLNGETAELGYRTPGWGKNRLNWNAVALQLINPEKMIDGSKLRPGQPVVALRERSIRSNGLTRARAILENAFLQQQQLGLTKRSFIADSVRGKIAGISGAHILSVLDAASSLGCDVWEQIQLPWHRTFPQLTDKLLTPSKIYAPLMYEAQGGVDGEVNIPLVACAHISGGGVPLKAKRMVEESGLGVDLEVTFPDPDGIPELMALVEQYPHPTKGPLIDNRSASEQWNRGVGFLCVTESVEHAVALGLLANSMGYEGALAGEITDQREINWRGEVWRY